MKFFGYVAETKVYCRSLWKRLRAEFAVKLYFLKYSEFRSYGPLAEPIVCLNQEFGRKTLKKYRKCKGCFWREGEMSMDVDWGRPMNGPPG